MNEYQGQGQNREPVIFPKRESPHDTLHMKQEPDELTTLGGKTRLVSPRSGGTGSSRGSRSPPTQSPLVSFSSPPPQTPTSPTSIPQSQNAYYTDPYTRRGYESTEVYPSSPEFAFLGHGNGNSQMHGQVQNHGVSHLQTAHVQNQAYAHHGQWSSGSSLAMNYGAPMETSSALPQVANTGLSMSNSQQVVHGNGLENISMLEYARPTRPRPLWHECNVLWLTRIPKQLRSTAKLHTITYRHYFTPRHGSFGCMGQLHEPIRNQLKAFCCR